LTHEQNEQDRHLQLEKLFQRNYGNLRDLAAEDPRLLAPDADNILQGLAARLAQYDGDLDEASFLGWAADIISGAVQRIGFFYGLQRECRKTVRAAIWSVLGKNLDLKDHSSTAFILEQIEHDTFVWAWRNLDSLMSPAKAKPCTRLYSQGRFHALTWRRSRLRDNDKFDEIDSRLIGTAPHEVFGRDYPYFDTHDDDEDDNERPVHRPKSLPIPSPRDSVLAMKSGRPSLLCPTCNVLQSISPEPPSKPDSVRLRCGHERPAALAAVA
jgi:hypothetical protein